MQEPINKMPILCERPEGLSQADYKQFLILQKMFIKHRKETIDDERLKTITQNGMKRQGKRAETI